MKKRRSQLSVLPLCGNRGNHIKPPKRTYTYNTTCIYIDIYIYIYIWIYTFVRAIWTSAYWLAFWPMVRGASCLTLSPSWQPLIAHSHDYCGYHHPLGLGRWNGSKVNTGKPSEALESPWLWLLTLSSNRKKGQPFASPGCNDLRDCHFKSHFVRIVVAEIRYFWLLKKRWHPFF